jgi:hypothetical protein
MISEDLGTRTWIRILYLACLFASVVSILYFVSLLLQRQDVIVFAAALPLVVGANMLLAKVFRQPMRPLTKPWKR